MLNKKKISAIAVAGALSAACVAGASLAYFNDEAGVTNTFTVGGVEIDLTEQQRVVDPLTGEKTTELEDFEQGKVLLPIVGSAQGEKDAIYMPTAENYVDKLATIENTGESDAWIRYYFAIPSTLDDGYDTFNAGLNVLHFNFGNDAEGTTCGDEWTWVKDGKWGYFETVIDGVNYNVYYADSAEALPAGETSAPVIQGVYLDKNVIVNDEGNLAIVRGGVETDLGVAADEEIKCPTFSVAVQASGFDDAASAVKASFGEQFNPFGGAVSNWQIAGE